MSIAIDYTSLNTSNSTSNDSTKVLDNVIEFPCAGINTDHKMRVKCCSKIEYQILLKCYYR